MSHEVQNVDGFAFRHGETVTIETVGDVDGCEYALMFASVPPLPTKAAKRDDGASVEALAVVAAHIVDGEWRWLHLTAQAKEILIDHCMLKCVPDVWHGMSIGPTIAKGAK